MMKRRPKSTVQTPKDFRLMGITIATIAFFIFFAIRPSATLIFTLIQQKADYESVNTTLEGKIQQLIEMQTNYIKALNKKTYIDKALPDNYKLEDMNILFNSAVTTTSFGLNEVQIHPKTGVGLITLPITIGGTAEYKDLLSYIQSVYVNARLFSIQNIKIEKADESSGSATIKYNGIFNTYYFIE